MHRDDRGNFELPRTEDESHAVLFRHAIETPCVVGRPVWQVESFLHPLPAPWARIKEWNDAKRLMGYVVHYVAKRVAGHHTRRVFVIEIDEVINFVEDVVPDPVGGSPLNEERVLVEH